MVASSCGVLTMCQVKCCTYTTSLDLLIIYEGALSVTVYQGPNRGWRAIICSLAVQHPFTLSDFHLRTHFLPEGLEWGAPFSSAVGCPRSQMSLTGMWVQCQGSQRFGCQGHLRPFHSYLPGIVVWLQVPWSCASACPSMQPRPPYFLKLFSQYTFCLFQLPEYFLFYSKDLWLSQA